MKIELRSAKAAHAWAFASGLSIALMLALGSMALSAQQLIPLPGAGARASIELLTNSGFEVDSNVDKLPDGWTGENTITSKSDRQKCNKVDKPVAHTGECAFMFRGNPDATASALTQTLSATSGLVNGASIAFSVYIDPRSSTPGVVFGKARLKASDGTKYKLDLTIPGGTRAPADYALVQAAQTLTLAPTVTIAKAKVKFSYAAASGKFLIDDASFTVTTLEATSTGTITTTIIPPGSGTPSVTPSLIPPTLTMTLTPSPTPTGTLTPTATLVQLKLIAADGAPFDLFG
ncbi:MAG: hypothetical protein H7Y11_15940, partial [Armatimonadetes bacterium]|nr:hypothetical protein [Anaerolineae bacterium]